MQMEMTPASSDTAESTARISRDRIDKENDLLIANEILKTTLEEIDRERAAHINKLQLKEKQLLDRLDKLNEEKIKAATFNGKLDASNDDLIEINAGGKIIAVKRGTLTQLHGSRLEALFCGRWEKKLIKDRSGRIFLDVNGDCFQAIVDYLNELAISSEDEPPEPPTVDDELEHILAHQMDIFRFPAAHPTIISTIITRYSDEMILQEWLKEAGSGRGLHLLYRSSRDGLSNNYFRSNCEDKGATVVIIETSEGDVVGGYTNTSWSNRESYAYADKAFLFALSGFGLSSPCKMKVMNACSQYAIYNYCSYGPIFGRGHDLRVNGSTLFLSTGDTYERGPSQQLTNGYSYKIKEMEVFRVTSNPAPPQDPRKKQLSSKYAIMENVEPVKTFSKKVNDAMNNKWATLHELEVDILSQEESFKDEEKFIEPFASGEAKDIVMLNVSGTMMTTSRATLRLCEDSVLAQQFDDSKWTAQGCKSVSNVKDWSPDDVTNWVKSLKDVPDDIATLFWENEIKGSELLALDKDGLKMLGVKRVGTICLLSEEIKKLKEASQDTATLIEYSPYCFGKILDYLRVERLNALGLIDEEPALPTVCESQKKRFEKVVKYYFPGECSKFILG